MTETLLPTWIIPEVEDHEWLDEGSSVFRSAFAPGLAQRQSYGGLRLKLSRRHTVRGEEKAQLLSILKSTRGSYNALRTKVHFASRGSFSGPELLTNNTFASGTTGWSAGVGASLSAADRALRIRRTIAGGSADSYASQATTVSLATPYVGRVYVSAMAGETSNGVSLSSTATTTTTGSSPGLYSRAMVPLTTTMTLFIENITATGVLVGSFFESRYASLARCALVDNGVNLLLRSDEIDNASWTKSNTTITANQFVTPDGTTTGDQIIETTANSSHAAEQAFAKDAAQRDYFVYGYFRAGSLAAARNRVQLVLYQGAGADTCSAIFDLTNGTIVTGPTVAGGMTNPRAAVVDAGGGWYLCWVGARSTTATSILLVMRMVQSGTTTTYTGQTTSDLGLWRLGMSDSVSAMGGTAVPGRPVQTTAVNANGSTGQTGDTLFTKGWPASTSGLLLPGDWLEVNGEIKQVSAPVNSNAAGLALLQFEPALVRSPSDNAPIVLSDPMGKFLVSNIKIENEFGTQARVSYDLEHIYE